MSILNGIVTAIFNALLAPFHGLPPWAGIGFISVIAGVLMLLLFKYGTSQSRMRRVKDRIMAHFLEVLIYRDDMRVFFGSQGNLLKQNSLYTALVMPAAILMVLIMLPFITQLEVRYGHRPFMPGETAVVAIELKDRIPGEDVKVSLVTTPGVEIETPAVHIRDRLEADWRIRAVSAGEQELTFRVGDEEYRRKLYVGSGYPRIYPQVQQASFGWLAENPGETPLPRDSQVKRIQIGYEERGGLFLGIPHLHNVWFYPFLIFSMVAGLILKFVLHVE